MEQENIIIYENSKKLFPFMLPTYILTLVGAGLFIAGLQGDTLLLVMGVVGLAVFGIGFINNIKRLFRPFEQLTITQEGISQYHIGFIPWEDIAAFEMAEDTRDVIRVILKKSDEDGSSHVLINFKFSQMRIEDILHLLRKKLAKYQEI